MPFRGDSHGRPPSRAIALGWALCLLLLAGCRAEPKGTQELALTTFWPEAEIWRETSVLDLGTAQPEPALLGGWSAPSRGLADYLWGTGERSELTFRRADARAFRIRMRGWAPPALPQGQEVGVALNGVELGRVRLGPEPQTVHVDVAAGTARPGWNRLELSYPVVVPTGRFGRPFGAAWDGFRFEETGASARSAVLKTTLEPTFDPILDPASGALAIPAGAGIDFFVDLAAGERLALAGVDGRGSTGLEADVECAGEPPRFGLLGRLAHGGREVEVRAPGLTTIPCRLTLRAEAGAQPEEAGSVAVQSVALQMSVPAHDRPPRAPSSASATTRASVASPLNIVIYIVDALRADRLGCYGERRALTPAIDRFAREAVLFENARAQSSWTRPAVATLFTGLTPLRHGATGVASRLPDDVATLAELLGERGYRTGYVTANGNTSEAFGFGQGIDFFRWVHGTSGDDKASWRKVHAAGREFLDRAPNAAPFFLVLHTVEPHAPYRPSSVQRARWAAGADRRLGERKILVELPGSRPGAEIVRQVSQLYDAEVADADAGFADFVVELERRGHHDDTALLFLSDHGEELFDHGNVEHGRTLYEEQLEIPMIWRIPGLPGGRRIAAPIDQLDVAPTLLELAGLPVGAEMHGRSFARALAGGDLPAPRSSAAWLDRLSFHQEAILSRGFKLIRNLQPRARTALADESLFDLAADRAERAEMAGDRELRLAILRAQLRGWAARSGPPLRAVVAAIDDPLRRELGALGYLH